jgi:hypothetical protein
MSDKPKDREPLEEELEIFHAITGSYSKILDFDNPKSEKRTIAMMLAMIFLADSTWDEIMDLYNRAEQAYNTMRNARANIINGGDAEEFVENVETLLNILKRGKRNK